MMSAFLFAGRGWAQSSEPPPPSIRVSAQATVQASPDQAEVDIGVVTRAPRSQPAAAANAEQSSRVLAAIRKLLGPEADLGTAAYSIRPVYSQPREPRDETAPMVTAYEVQNIVRVTLTDLMKIDEVIDAATGAGANRIEAVRFSLRDEASVHAKALRRAAEAARARAETLASALGVRIARVLSASEDSPPVRPFAELSVQRGQPGTPIEIGAIDVTASVTLVVEVASAPPA
jgi:uncharacterized protein